jgi:hypothetical protein
MKTDYLSDLLFYDEIDIRQYRRRRLYGLGEATFLGEVWAEVTVVEKLRFVVLQIHRSCGVRL